MKKILLIGGGGHCTSCIDVIELEQKYEISGIIDRKKTIIKGYKYLGSDKVITEKKIKVKNILITIGQITNPNIRKNLFKKFILLKYNFPVIISPLAYVSKKSIIDKGTIIHHRVNLNAMTKIGKNCIINTGCIVEHDSLVENNCHLSTGSIINGNVNIGEGSFIGSNAVIREGVKIGKNCIVGAGVVLKKNLTDNSVIK